MMDNLENLIYHATSGYMPSDELLFAVAKELVDETVRFRRVLRYDKLGAVVFLYTTFGEIHIAVLDLDYNEETVYSRGGTGDAQTGYKWMRTR